MAKLPLEGIRVLEITVVWAGPHSSQILADWGADVIRVESTQFLGTTTRTGLMRPERNYFKVMIEMGYGYAGRYPESRAWDRGALFNTHARNKRSMTVDVTRPEGLEIFKDLISKSDVLIENNMPDTMKKLGLVYSELKKHNPGLIMVRMPAFGLDGKYHRYRSWGQHVEGVAGHSWLKGYRDTDISQRPESNQSDSGAAYSAVLAVLMAIRHRNLTGEGQLIEIPLCENFIPSLAAPIIDYTMNGRVRSSLGNGHTSMAPHGVYRCKGPDSWVAISVGSDAEWEGLCQVLGNPEWTREKRFRTVLGRWNNQEELDQSLNQWTQTLTQYEVTTRLQGAGVAAAPVLDEKGAHADPHIKARGFFQTVNDPDLGTHDHVGFMWKMARTPNAIRKPPAHLGYGNEYVYKELLGYDDERYERLEEEGHIGTEPAPHIP